MQHKSRSIPMEVKALAEDGSFEGLLSPYGNTDQGNDVVLPGAFTKSLMENGNTVPMLWQHKPDCPIGQLTLSDQEDGLYCKGQLLLEIPEAQKAYALLKAQYIKGLSIGYEPVKKQTINGVRQLSEIKLFEGSVVTFPMNLSALVTSVKQRESKSDFADEYADQQISSQLSQMLSALSSALYSLPWSGLSTEDAISAAETTLEQFSETYLAYLPLYLEYLAREYGLDTKSWQSQREVKEGRKISAATRQNLSDAHGHLTAAMDALTPLLSDDDDYLDPDDPDGLVTKSHAEMLGTMLGMLR